MDKKKLKQYIPLKKEQKMLDEKLDKLRERALDIPTVLGKVKGSSKEFPYIETHMTVCMDEPKQADVVGRQTRINEKRKERVNTLLIEIEEFIAAIPDSVTRQIFELVFLEGKTQQEVGERIGYTKGRISQIINNYLKD
ncbi:MAG: sigma factor-like helix-turn-helix DNA-binding protein [Anaerostipes faecalis]|nr:sigma factor-like helix-turn-helix DNA-binding protein [Anaerostipes faecalis]